MPASLSHPANAGPRSIVLVAGAGASLAHARALGCAPEMEPPLDRSFLRNPQSWSDVTSEWFRKSVQIYLGDDDLAAYRMEEVFSYAYADTQWYELLAEKRGFTDDDLRSLAQSAEVLERLIHNFQLALAMTTNPLACGPTDGALGPVLRRLMDMSGGALTVITFNQDLLLERTLEQLHISSNPGVRFPFPGVYGLSFDSVASGSEGLNNLGSFARAGSAPRGTLLKLHGSFNWFVSMPTATLIDQTPPLYSTLFHSGAKSLCLDNRELLMDGRRDIRPKGAGYDRWIPWVVPPVMSKTTWLDSPLWPMWEQAAIALSRASDIVLWGYSVPRSDRHALQLLVAASKARHREAAISVIDPAPTVAARLARHTGLTVTPHSSHEDFLQSAR